MNDYKSLLAKYGPKTVDVQILDDPFKVRRLSARDAEEMKLYGFEAKLSKGNEITMEIKREEYVDRTAMILHKCLLFPDGSPCFANVKEAGAIGSEFSDAAVKKCQEVNDLTPGAVEQAEKNS